MPGLELTCPACRTRFQLNITGLVGIYGSVAHCPKCDNIVEIPNGTYDLRGLVTELVQAKPSVEEWTALYTALRVIDSSDVAPDKAIAAVEEAAPRLAGVFGGFYGVSAKEWFRWLRVLLSIIPALLLFLKRPEAAAETGLVLPFAMEQLSKAQNEAEALETPEEKRKKKNKAKQRRKNKGKKR